jgi:hypothetical protein
MKLRTVRATALLVGISAPAFATDATLLADSVVQGIQCDVTSKWYDKTTLKEITDQTSQHASQYVFEFTADGKMFGFVKSVNGKLLTGLSAELSSYTVVKTPGHYVFTTTYLAHGVRRINIDRVTGVMSGHDLNPDAPVDIFDEGTCSSVALPEPKL